MKKSIIIILALLLFSTTAFANSGPVYWKQHPHVNVMTVDENSPIEIRGEDLSFDFSQNEEFLHAYEAKVTAEYEMVNPTDKDLFVQMAFPFIKNLGTVSDDNITISADNKDLPYDIYLGESIKGLNNFIGSEETEENSFDFKKIIETVNSEPYKAINFEEDEIGKLYSIAVKPSSNESIEIAVDFAFDYVKTKIFAKGFNGFRREGKDIKITAFCQEPIMIYLYVLGEDIDFKVTGYTDGTLKDRSNLFTYEISEKNLAVKTHLTEYARNNLTVNYENISDLQLYNLLSSTMDRVFSSNLGFCSSDEISSENSMDRMVVLVYTVEFPRTSQKKIKVSYQARGTMDKRHTSEPTYTYDYILNPAETWNDFKNLNIKITPPLEVPYIIKSSLELNKEGNSYTASFKNLPENDLSFTLYHKEKVTLIDRLKGEISFRFGYFAPFVCFSVLTLVLIFMALIVKRRKAKQVEN